MEVNESEDCISYLVRVWQNRGLNDRTLSLVSPERNGITLGKSITCSRAIHIKNFAKYQLLIDDDTINRLEETHRTSKNSLVHDLLRRWIESKRGNATESEFRIILHDFKATLQTWLYFQEYEEREECTKSFEEHRFKLFEFVVELCRFFNSRTVSKNDWKDFCVELSTEDLDDKEETLYNWIERHGYIDATIVKMKDILRKLNLRRAIAWVECNQGGRNVYFPPLCKPFDDFLKCVVDRILQDLRNEQKRELFRACESDNEDQLFSKIYLKGNRGFHIFFRKLTNKVKDLSRYFDERNLSLFTLNQVPKCLLPENHTFVKLEDYENVDAWFNLFKELVLFSNHMLDSIHFVSDYVARFVRKEPLTIVRFIDANSEDSFNEALILLINLLLDAGFHHLVDSNDVSLRPIDSLAIVLKEIDFHVFLIFYNCCKKILQKSSWSKFVVSEGKTHIVFLTTKQSAKSLGRFQHRSLEERTEEQICDVFNSAAEEKNNTLAVANFCGKSLLHLSIARNFLSSNDYSAVEFKELLSMDTTKDQWFMFLSEYFQDNIDPAFHKLAGFRSNPQAFVENEQSLSLQEMKEEMKQLQDKMNDFDDFKKKRTDFEDQTKSEMRESKVMILQLKEDVRQLRKDKQAAEEKLELLQTQHQQELEKKDKEIETRNKEIEFRDQLIVDLKSELQSCKEKLEKHEQQERERRVAQEEEFRRKQLQTDENMKKLQEQIAEFLQKVNDLEKKIAEKELKITEKEKSIAELKNNAPHTSAKHPSDDTY